MDNNNLLYNIIKNEPNQLLFLYGVFLFIIILVFTNINFSFSLFIGLIIYSIVISYIYTYNTNNTITEKYKLNQKSKSVGINDENPEIVDFLFYLESYKQFSIYIYNNIVILLKNFIKLYNDCITNKKLINDYYSVLENLKFLILYTLESFNLNGANLKELKKNKLEIEKILNKYLEQLLLLQKKDLYYNGFNTKTKILTTDNVVEYNKFDYRNEYNRGIRSFDIQNLESF
jgi:hypothetical protein